MAQRHYQFKVSTETKIKLKNQLKRYYQLVGNLDGPSYFMYRILHSIINQKPSPDIRVIDPADGEDFIKIGLLILAKPEWEKNLPQIARYSGAWRGLVDNWSKLVHHFFYSEELNERELNFLLYQAINQGRIKYGCDQSEQKQAQQEALRNFLPKKSGINWSTEKISVQVAYHLIPMIIRYYHGKVNISWSWSVLSTYEEDNFGDDFGPVQLSGWSIVYRLGDLAPLLPPKHLTPGILKITFPMDQANETMDLFAPREFTDIEQILKALSPEERTFNLHI